MKKGIVSGVVPVIIVGGLVFVGYGDQWSALPPKARQVSGQVRQSVTQLLVKTIPQSAPHDDRYDRSWDMVDGFDRQNQGTP